jgi:hypothetical protein
LHSDADAQIAGPDELAEVAEAEGGEENSDNGATDQ